MVGTAKSALALESNERDGSAIYMMGGCLAYQVCEVAVDRTGTFPKHGFTDGDTQRGLFACEMRVRRRTRLIGLALLVPCPLHACSLGLVEAPLDATGRLGERLKVWWRQSPGLKAVQQYLNADDCRPRLLQCLHGQWRIAPFLSKEGAEGLTINDCRGELAQEVDTLMPGLTKLFV